MQVTECKEIINKLFCFNLDVFNEIINLLTY